MGRKVNVEQTLLPQDQRVRKEWLDCRGSLVGKERRETKDLEVIGKVIIAMRQTVRFGEPEQKRFRVTNGSLDTNTRNFWTHQLDLTIGRKILVLRLRNVHYRGEIYQNPRSERGC